MRNSKRKQRSEVSASPGASHFIRTPTRCGKLPSDSYARTQQKRSSVFQSKSRSKLCDDSVIQNQFDSEFVCILGGKHFKHTMSVLCTLASGGYVATSKFGKMPTRLNQVLDSNGDRPTSKDSDIRHPPTCLWHWMPPEVSEIANAKRSSELIHTGAAKLP